jgi:hypothetical protein
MKILYLGSCLAFTSPSSHAIEYEQSSMIERDRIEVIYLPNNTCHITIPTHVQPNSYKDFVRACLNNQHLRVKIDIHHSN